MTTNAAIDAPKKHLHPAIQFAVLAALLVVGYMGTGVLRFTSAPLDLIVNNAYFTIPYFAIRPALRLHGLQKILGLMLLAPFLLFSSLILLFTIVDRGLLGESPRTHPLQTFQIGKSTVQLETYDYGGAVGVHGLNLVQRRPIFPGVDLVRSIDFYDSATEGTLSMEGPVRVRVHAIGSYANPDRVINEAYPVKTWVYF